MSGDTLQVNVSEKIQTHDELAGTKHYRAADGTVYSVHPPTAYLTFTNWIYMVPPFKPTSVLMLGYAGGTVAGLIQMLYGHDVPIVGVDPCFVDNRYGVQLIQGYAEEFVKMCRDFECVIIDIFNGQKTPECVINPTFVEHIARITERFLVIHADPSVDMGIYEQYFTRLRLTDIGHKVYYFKPKDSTEDFYCR